MSSKNLKVLVAMSGGVDSSVAAFLLREQGCEVVGITLRLWHADDDKQRPGGCCALTDIADARRVCDHLGIKHYVMNREELFRETVVDDFADEYLRGRTPNPCIVCNEKIKFNIMLKQARALGFDYMATGHYARIRKGRAGYSLIKGKDPKKDQSYVLYRLTQKELSRILLPIGDFAKPEIRAIAEKNRLPVAHKPDSQEICFINTSYADFLRSYIKDFDRQCLPGPIKGLAGKVLGTHKGLPFYTIGQRSGLGISSPRPLYVTNILPKQNTLVVGEKQDAFANCFEVKKLTWTSNASPKLPLNAEVKIRYLHTAAKATLRSMQGKLTVEFKTPQFAVTPGQSAVFYKGDTVIGGGIISKTAAGHKPQASS